MPDIEADVVVIGAGPSGGAASLRLAQAGLSVVILERGHWLDYGTMDREAPDWEARRAGPLNPNPNRRRGPDDCPVEDTESPIKAMIGHAVGGTSPWWSAHVPRFRPEDFRVRSLDGVADDWPIDHNDLAPHYDAVEGAWGVAGVAGDPSGGPKDVPRLSLPTIGAHGERIIAAMERLGWHWWPVDLAVGQDAEAPTNGVCTHPGPCEIGCPARVRSGADRAFIARAIACGARLICGARVQHLERTADGRVAAAVCRDDTGQYRVKGAQFVLAAGGIGTPRLLLLSGDGFANRSGLVGRNLMLHPHARIDGLFPERLGTWIAGQKAGVVTSEFLATRPDCGFVRGFRMQLGGGPDPLSLAHGALVGPIPWGDNHHAAFAARFDHICGVTVCGEDLPEPTNRITLSDHLKDRDGLPAAKMIYRLSSNSRVMLDTAIARAEELLCEAGAIQFAHERLREQAGFHPMGTARMGCDPERSVADSYGMCHDIKNLFLADASTFVTGSTANPTLTAQAIALRAADRIIGLRVA